MRWHTHVIGGVASLWLVSGVILPPVSTGAMQHGLASLANPGVLAVWAALGALLPDLDASDSRLQRIEVVRGIAPFAPVGKILSSLLGHRGAMHSLLGLSVTALLAGLPVALFLGALPALALLLGYGSHLLLDAMTIRGIPLLFPSKHRFWLLPWRWVRVVTGSPEEEVVFVVLVVLALVLLLRSIMFLP